MTMTMDVNEKLANEKLVFLLYKIECSIEIKFYII